MGTKTKFKTGLTMALLTIIAILPAGRNRELPSNVEHNKQ